MNKELLAGVSRVVDSVRIADSNKKLEEYLLGSLRANGLETMVNIVEHEDGYRISEQGNEVAYLDVYLDDKDTLEAGRSRMAQGLNGWAINNYAQFAGISREQARGEAERLFAWFADVEAKDGRPVEELKNIKITDAAVGGIEWASENLSGHGGTEIDGRWYYTYEQALAAVKELGDGWRLPTDEELQKLADAGSTWDAKLKGRWFGGNHDTDHEGSIFLPAAGYLSRITGTLTRVGWEGRYWGNLPVTGGSPIPVNLDFGTSYAYPLNSANRANGFPVRLVR